MALVELSEHRIALKERIDAEIALRLPEWFAELPAPQLAWLQTILADGKRLRGCLACLVAEALGGRVERALPAAVAVEIVHAASLVHDDFVDGDAMRRGRAAAWTWLSPRRAVLAADVMFATTLERMASLGAREAATLARAIATMARGALHEVLDGEHAHQRIIEWKTGALFAAAARLGALAADGDPAVLEAAYRYGMRTGEAYQRADDLADHDAPSVTVVELGELIDKAAAAVTAFPDNAYTRMLQELPAAFVAAMAA